MKKFVVLLFILFNGLFLFSQNYVISVESTKKDREPQLTRINGNQYELITVGEIINERDTLKTMPYTKAKIQFEDLSIDIAPLSQIVVKYAYIKEKQFKAMYELKKGNLKVSFDSSKYDDKDLKIYLPKRNTTLIVTGTEFTVDSNGYVKVIKGTVRLEKDSSIRDRPPKVRFLEAGDFGSIDSEIVNHKDQPPRRDFEPQPRDKRDRDRPAPQPRDREPKGKREPAQAPGMNKAPAPKDNRK